MTEMTEIGNTIMLAIDLDEPKKIQSLVDKGLIKGSVRLIIGSRRNVPALVYAVQRGRKHIVKILLDAGALIDDSDEFGTTACHAAASFKSQSLQSCRLIRLLLTRKPNLTLLDWHEFSALDHALERGYVESVKMLLDGGALLNSATTLERLGYFASSSTAAVQLLINRNVAVNKLMCGGQNPLHLSVCGRHTNLETTRVLVSVCGINIDSTDYFGRTALALAACYGSDMEIMRWLIHAGANADLQACDGSTALHSARNYECVLILLAAGSNVHLENCHGETAAFRFIYHNNLPILTALFVCGARIDASQQSRLKTQSLCFTDDGIATARRDISRERLNFVRRRALEVCIGLQALNLDALQTCEILQYACGPVAPLIRFHHWWQIATTVKHFNRK